MNHYFPLLWKAVPDFEGLYEINGLGTVRSIDRTVTLRNGKTRRYFKKYIVTRISNRGYRQLRLSKGGKTYTVNRNRLVALAFVPSPQNKPYVNHLNGVKTDDYWYNLEWVDHRENIKHAYKQGLITYKSKPVYDRQLKKWFASAKKAAAFYGIQYGTLRNYLNGNIKHNPTCLSYHRSR